MADQHRQQHPEVAPADADDPIAVNDLQWAEYPQPHGVLPCPGRMSRRMEVEYRKMIVRCPGRPAQRLIKAQRL
jgi:hypothetical protein